MTARIQTELFDPTDFMLQGPEDKLTADARANLAKSFGSDRPGGTPYMPSNGTEECVFASIWCDRCVHDDPDSEVYCEIFTQSILGEQPKEWTYEGGKACCWNFGLQYP